MESNHLGNANYLENILNLKTYATKSNSTQKKTCTFTCLLKQFKSQWSNKLEKQKKKKRIKAHTKTKKKIRFKKLKGLILSKEQ